MRQILITEDDESRVVVQVNGIPSLSDRVGLLRLALVLVERELESKIEETKNESTSEQTSGGEWPLELDASGEEAPLDR